MPRRAPGDSGSIRPRSSESQLAENRVQRLAGDYASRSGIAVDELSHLVVMLIMIGSTSPPDAVRRLSRSSRGRRASRAFDLTAQTLCVTVGARGGTSIRRPVRPPEHRLTTGHPMRSAGQTSSEVLNPSEQGSALDLRQCPAPRVRTAFWPRRRMPGDRPLAMLLVARSVPDRDTSHRSLAARSVACRCLGVAEEGFHPPPCTR